MRCLTAIRTGGRKIEIVEEEVSCNPQEMLIGNMYFSPSVGTEMVVYRQGHSGPLKTGEMGVGEVLEVGREVRGFKKGDWVIADDCGLSSLCVVGQDVLHIKEGIDLEEASFLHQARVALTGVRRARIVLGDSVLVIGVGAIGNIAMQLSRLAGAEQVIAADLYEKRLEIAKSLGADEVIDAGEEDIGTRTLELTEGRGADIVLEASGSPKAIQPAMKAAKMMARIVIMGFITKSVENLMLGGDFHAKHLELISARKTLQFPGDFNHSDHWTAEASYYYLLELMRKRKLKIKEMITHRFTLEETGEAFRLMDEHPEEILGIVISTAGIQ